MTDQEILTEALALYREHGLEGWTFAIVDEHPRIEQAAGFTFFDDQKIEIYRELWPTQDCNIIEVVRHETAHALVGHGRHDREWWAKLAEIGGSGSWMEDTGQPAPWSWTLEKILP